MLKTMIRLPDGTELSSGAEHTNAIRSVKLTQCVNSAKELTLGSTCAGMVEVDIQTPNGGLQIHAGDEIALYRTQDGENYRLLGLFITESPKRTSANTLRLTAYDRVTKLDRDLSEWLEGLTGWPYRLYDFAQMVCGACGLTLANDTIPNGDYEVQAFAGQNITGRTLIQWVGEAAGRFCRATAEGQLEFAWYTPSEVALAPAGRHFFYQNGLSFEDYQVAPIEKVQIKQTQNDVGVVWPDETGEKNTYVICGNFLLTTESTETLLPVAQTLYAQLKTLSYTPCKVQLPAGMDIQAGQIVDITDRNGKTVTAFVMTKTQAGQRDTLECTGSHRRDSTSVVNNEKYSAISKRTLEIERKVEGLAVAATQLDKTLRDTQTDLQSVHTSVGEVNVKADAVNASVSDLTQIISSTNGEVMEAKEQIASLALHSDALEIKIGQVVNDGTSRVSNTTGTFNEDGLQIDSTDSATKTQITPDGMTVLQKSYGDTAEVLTATSDGVNATNLHAKTYLIIGGRSRFENYGSNRTGCFWIGE